MTSGSYPRFAWTNGRAWPGEHPSPDPGDSRADGRKGSTSPAAVGTAQAPRDAPASTAAGLVANSVAYVIRRIGKQRYIARARLGLTAANNLSSTGDGLQRCQS